MSSVLTSNGNVLVLNGTALSHTASSSTTITPLNVTSNGTYTAPSGTAYSPVTVNVSGGSGGEAVAEVAFGTFGNNTLSFDLSTTSISSVSDLYGYAIIHLYDAWLSTGGYLANMYMTFSPGNSTTAPASAILSGSSSSFCVYCYFTLSNTTLSSTTIQYYELGNSGESLEIYSPSAVLYYIPYKLSATITSVGSFTFTNGTTWTTFVNSADNTLGLVISSGYVKSSKYYVVNSATNEYASSSAKIRPGTYSLTASAPGPEPPGPGPQPL